MRPPTDPREEGSSPLTDDERARFLDYVREHPKCSVKEAARTVGRKRWEFRQILAEHDFEEDYLEARGRSRESIRGEIHRRAIEGVEEPVFHQGEVVGHIRKFSDHLLVRMAQAYLPEYQQAGRVELTGADGGPIAIEGRAIVGLADVVALARTLGIDFEGGRDAESAGRGLPAPQDVLPDPPERLRPPGALPPP